MQFVIARSSAPTAPRPATRVRCSTARNGSAVDAPAEYFDYNSAVTGRHAIAAGATAWRAYDVFKPNVPQNFTSGGPALIFFDRDQNLYPTPEVRLQPRLAAANGSNRRGGAQGDSGNDIDTGGGQFYGTSAAAPHAAGIAALVLDAKGGPGTVTPTQMSDDSAEQHVPARSRSLHGDWRGADQQWRESYGDDSERQYRACRVGVVTILTRPRSLMSGRARSAASSSIRTALPPRVAA